MRVVVENFGVIRELSVELPEVFLLFGPNGVGKTTIYAAITAFGYLEWGKGLYLGRHVSAWRRTPRGRVSVSVEGLPFPRSKCYGVSFPHDVVEELRRISADHANRLAQCDYGRVTYSFVAVAGDEPHVLDFSVELDRELAASPEGLSVEGELERGTEETARKLALYVARLLRPEPGPAEPFEERIGGYVISPGGAYDEVVGLKLSPEEAGRG